MVWHGYPRTRTTYIHVLILTFIALLFSALNTTAEQDSNSSGCSTKTIPITRETASVTRCTCKITKNTNCSAKQRKGTIGHLKNSYQHDMDAREAIQNIMPSFNK